MTKVVFEIAARKALKAMPARDAAALERKLTIDAQTGVGDVAKLTGVAKWRLRHGDWRAIFVRRSDVVVVEIAHRREVYRQEAVVNEAVTLSGEAMIVMTRAEHETLIEDIGDAAIADHAHSLNVDAPRMPSELVMASIDGTLHPLAAWRRSVELTEAELAAKAGLPEATVRAIETRDHDPRLSELKALAGALRLGIEDIVD